MKISKTITRYLSNSYSILKSNIIITNLSSIILSNNEKISCINAPLSDDLKNLIAKWENCENSEQYLLLTNNFIKICNTDPYSYMGQIIFPIFHNNKLDGLLIFFRNKQNFIQSSLKYAKTVKHFTEIFTDDDFTDKNI
jgi:hypothetical protein